MSVTLVGALAIFVAPAAAAEPSAATGAASTEAANHAAFLAENDRAMERMMNEMAITPSGNVDRDFVHMMVPHHRGAIEMAMAQLRHGRNPQLRRLAQEIIATQQQEIAAMYLAIGLAPPAADTSADTSAITSTTTAATAPATTPATTPATSSADMSSDPPAVAGGGHRHRTVHHSHKEPR
ncbi:DUF305 domain-containing protein [Cupriavidus sp. DB3]|uniref:DUF305 domain-containing protein n=1 Tax=Cupriavidus sp. DB3 TaxID=2873259 RepID=UPI001CF3CE72|nr:DUF305 domain-containing protein [Cupriavidus sp. DB3]MCA7085663.1 DUF305 domain-containing protein [Cupriavidus sp. DB3]